MNKLSEYSGLILSLLIASVSFFLSQFHPSFDSLVVSIIFGMLLSNMLVKREQLQKGIDVMMKFFLPLGIAFYGTQLTFESTGEYRIWLYVIAVFILSLSVTFRISRIFRLNGRLAVLLASGFAICGASAIAVMSPLIGAKKKDTSISIISIMVIGLLSVVFYPVFWKDAGLIPREFAFFSGTTIPMLGQVKITAQSAGMDVLGLALRVKLMRVSMLLFLVASVLIFSGRDEKRLYIPWFMIAFIIFVILTNFGGKISSMSRIFEPFSRFFLSSALAAIGLSVDFDSITSEGARPLLAVLFSWIIISAIIFTGLRLLHV